MTRKLVIFGAGLQAEAHLFCMLPQTTVKADSDDDEIYDMRIREVTVINRSVETAKTFVESFKTIYGRDDDGSGGVHFMEPIALADANAVRDAVSDADIIVTGTGSSTPLFDGSWMKSRCHVNCVGSYRTDHSEVDSSVLRRCTDIIVDSFGAVMTSGDLSSIVAGVSTRASGAVEKETEMMLTDEATDSSFRVLTIGRLLSAETSFEMTPMTASRCCTLFKSVGTAVQDISTASAVVQRATMMKVGSTVAM